MADLQQYEQELVRRERALQGMHAYREYIVESGHADFLHPPAAHHDIIIAACERLLDPNHPSRRLLIMAPPGSAKSTYTSVQFATMFLAKNPSLHILCCSNTTDLAIRFNRRRRSCVETKEWQNLAGTSLDPENKGAEEFSVLAGGSIIAKGVGSAITGTRSDLNILDDPIASWEEAMSTTQLKKQEDWYDADYRTRLKPEGLELLISTRWSRKDLAGIMLARHAAGDEEWEVIRLPMLADSVDDPLGRSLNEPLWPEWFTDHQIKMARKNPLKWQTMYQQRPPNESGAWVSENEIPIVPADQVPDNLRILAATDLSLGVSKGDFNVIMIAGIDENRRLYILDVHRQRIDPKEAAQQMLWLQRKWKASEFLIDNDPAAQMFIGLLLDNARRQNIYIPLRPLKLGNKDKETRAAAIRGYFKMGEACLQEGAWNRDLIEEMLDFPGGDHDDQIDCLSLLGRQLSRSSGATPPPTRTPPPPEGFIVPGPNGELRTRATLNDLFEDHEFEGKLRLSQRRRI